MTIVRHLKALVDLPRMEHQRINEAAPTAHTSSDLSARTVFIRLGSGLVNPATGCRSPFERGSHRPLVCVARVDLDGLARGTRQRGFSHAD